MNFIACILRLPEPTLTTPGSEYGRRCYPVRANKRWRTWGGLEGGGGGGGGESRPLYLLLFFSWRLSGSRFLIEKHAVKRASRTLLREKNRAASAGTSERMQNLHEICRANEKNVLRYYSGDKSWMSIRDDVHVNELQDGLRQRITSREQTREEPGRS